MSWKTLLQRVAGDRQVPADVVSSVRSVVGIAGDPQALDAVHLAGELYECPRGIAIDWRAEPDDAVEQLRDALRAAGFAASVASPEDPEGVVWKLTVRSDSGAATEVEMTGAKPTWDQVRQILSRLERGLDDELRFVELAPYAGSDIFCYVALLIAETRFLESHHASALRGVLAGLKKAAR